jgi:glycine/D-amino acid oxidase-like deaminating enzyme
VGGRLNLGKGGGGIAFAGRVGERFDGRSPIADRLTQELHSFYPSLARASIVSAWRGPVSRTDLGLPFFGRLRDQPNIVYGHGYSGNGVGPSYIGGQILASLALRQTDEWSTSALARPPSGSYPPEPLRYMGGRLVRAAVVRKERAEDQGRRPGRITLALSRLAPSGPGSPPKN